MRYAIYDPVDMIMEPDTYDNPEDAEEAREEVGGEFVIVPFGQFFEDDEDDDDGEEW
jgi:hypothetical protein